MKEVFTEGDIFEQERKKDPLNDINKTISKDKYV